MRLMLYLLIAFYPARLCAQLLHTGPGQRFAQLTDAALAAVPGDTILLHPGEYPGAQDLGGLNGAPGRWVYILPQSPGTVTFRGGTHAWHGSGNAYLHIEGITFTGQTGNGLNLDDGNNSPAHHIVLRECSFREMAATGNNDLLKLSGVDDFTITHCTFEKGAAGGSGIDMVGCHNGFIFQCRFTDLGANGVQMKGGSSDIRVEACVFQNAGSRAVNLGGSTGAAFFRPAGAQWEATRLTVCSNVFLGSDAPVAFVGCTDSEVVNNTIYKPSRWALRILQENKDTARLAKCGQNIFRNNIVYVDEQLRTACNIGAGTSPETFIFSHNLWFHEDSAGWKPPPLPASETGGLYGQAPLFTRAGEGDFSIPPHSPAAAAGFPARTADRDHRRNRFRSARAIGAFEVPE